MFIPIKDDVPTRRFPLLTVMLMIINTAIFIYTWMLGPRGLEYYVITYGFTPLRFFHGSDLSEYVGMSINSPVLLTPFSSMFLHGGWMHLIGNMLVLWIYGNNIEDYFGPIKFLIFYVLSGIAAIALYSIANLDSPVPLVGASGAIAGVMGGYIVLHPRARVTILIFFFFIQFVTLPASVVLGLWFLMQVFMSFTGATSGGGVAFLAHVGGFVFGWVILKLFVAVRGQRPRDGQQIYRMQW